MRIMPQKITGALLPQHAPTLVMIWAAYVLWAYQYFYLAGLRNYNTHHWTCIFVLQ